ncbi:MAG TPA: DinB family protein, partial [Acidimicrobiia bacterium]|nr:DinB family protein [Acidimicrobiia bacterium]
PVTGDGPGVIPLGRLLAALQEGQERISAALAALPEEALGEEQTVGDRRLTLEERLHFAYFHDTYHTGQTELLRAAAGRTDKVL